MTTNPVGTWADADNETQSGAAYRDNLDNDLAVAKRPAAAFAPHEYYEGSPAALGMKVEIDAGYIRSGATLTEVAAQQTTDFTAPVSNPRIDRIVGDVATGAIEVVAGTEAGSPAAPAIPSGKFPIAQVALATSTTAITNQEITDERALGILQVNTDDLVDDAVTTAKIAAAAVDTTEIADEAITSAKLAAGAAVANIGSGGITTSLLAAGNRYNDGTEFSVTGTSSPLTLDTGGSGLYEVRARQLLNGRTVRALFFAYKDDISSGTDGTPTNVTKIAGASILSASIVSGVMRISMTTGGVSCEIRANRILIEAA